MRFLEHRDALFSRDGALRLEEAAERYKGRMVIEDLKGLEQNPRLGVPGGDHAHPDPALCPAPAKPRLHRRDPRRKAGCHGRDEVCLGDRREK